jgi:glutaredoxin
MLSVQFYTRKDCDLCHSALLVLKRLQRRIPFQIEIIDIESDPVLIERYGTVIPVITSGSRELARSFPAVFFRLQKSARARALFCRRKNTAGCNSRIEPKNLKGPFLSIT